VAVVAVGAGFTLANSSLTDQDVVVVRNVEWGDAVWKE
jgi:hypothetical protein